MVSSWYFILPVVLLIGLFRKCRARTWGTCKNTDSLEGRVCIVTGANSGIGKETVKELAKRNATVILACRNLQNARTAISEIRTQISTGKLVPMKLNLASFSSIREFAAEVIQNFAKIHVLINNAGVYVPFKEHALTEDGFEIHFGVNHLGHFLLTNLLLDHLQQSAPSRIVIVTSKLYESGVIDFSNLNEKSGVNVYIVCPGFTYTGLFRNVKRSWFHYIIFSPIALLYLRTANQGAQTVLHCAIEPSLSNETGNIYRDCKLYVSKKKLDTDVAIRLWDVSVQLTRLKENIK
ncbi:Retinol dehydrogenase 11 [Anthophora quadrimaculata]